MARKSILTQLNKVFISITLLVIIIASIFAFTSQKMLVASNAILRADLPLEMAIESMNSTLKAMQTNAALYLLGYEDQKQQYQVNLALLQSTKQTISHQKLLTNNEQINAFYQVNQLSNAINQQYQTLIFDVYSPEDEKAAKQIAANLLENNAKPLEKIIDFRAQDEIKGSQESSDEEELRYDDIPAIHYYLQLVDEAGDMQNALASYLLNDKNAKQEFDENGEAFVKWLTLLEPLEQDEDEVADITHIKQLFEQLLDGGYQLFNLYNPESLASATHAFNQLKQTHIADIEQQMSVLLNSTSNQVVSQLEDLKSTNIGSIILLALFAMITIILLISLSFYTKRTIYLPIEKLAKSVDALRLGERNIQFIHNDDELGDVFKNVEKFQHDLRQLDALQKNEAQYKLQLELERDKLQQALNTLQQAQKKLINSEKMASLGALVAGISHEINTPIGIAVTISSTFESRVKEFVTQARTGQLNLSDLEMFEQESLEGLVIMQKALNRAAELIHSFKQVAIDQSSNQRRSFLLDEMLNEVFNTLKHQIKRSTYTVSIDCPADIMMDSFPGPFGQVITNLFNNAIIHGFDGAQTGDISVKVYLEENDKIKLQFNDNGIGIPVSHIDKIFDPFFTTKLGQGGSGLGMNIVYNIVNNILGGDISVTSHNGTTFTLIIPIIAPK
ncbi:sensor histidine kinase [Shewanella subflava]|uniref:histidine kinase n=1 Tax=Shewanella subflava TaxID=2986476 RepID=A0ABT3IBK3_9GAMM|nr:HAMP domain-containing sensor histidine kinase [Shewanella subflava]MCW3173258.1 HAMP domain-containing histidine kinase [Shewanella subflava]